MGGLASVRSAVGRAPGQVDGIRPYPKSTYCCATSPAGSTRWRPALPPHPRRSRREVAYVDERLRRPRGRRQALAPLVSISTYLVLIAVTRSQAICWPLVALRLSDQRCRAWRLDLQDGRSVAAQKHGHAAGLRPGRRDFQTPRMGRLAAGSAVRNRRCTK
jgi:hypothetical protein